MDIEKIKLRKTRRSTRRFSQSICIRVSPAVKIWLKEKSFSPTGLFMQAMAELGFKEVDYKEAEKKVSKK